MSKTSSDDRGAWPAFDLTIHDPALRHDDVLTVLHESGMVGLVESDDARWRIFYTETGARDRTVRLLRDTYTAGITIDAFDVPDEAWARRSQASLRAIRVGDLVVAPPWDLPDGAPPDRTIVIEPSTGFGTGHHATTRLCLLALQALDLTGCRVLDLGTGSGLLAIAAARCGATEAVGIDCDADAIAAARENVARNGMATRVHLERGDLRRATHGCFDVVVANLTGALLARAAGHVMSRVRPPHGRAIISGFTIDDAPDVEGAFSIGGMVLDRHREDEWVAFIVGRGDGR